MLRPRPIISRASAIVLAGLAVYPVAHRVLADEPGLPRSLDEAIQMEHDDAFPLTTFYETPSLTSSKPGDLLRQEPFTGYKIPEGASAVRILYHSLSAEGKDVATSGVVLIPAGTAPSGGWPVIAWAHGTSGVARMCAPSLMKDMEYGEEGLMPMVRAGFAVVATDYHGLGTAGPHEYVNKIAQARDVIFSVPAARAAVPSLGRKWVVDGHSQGGLAAWSVAEMEATRHDPDYLGAVSVAGASDFRVLLTGMDEPQGMGFYLTYMAYAIHTQTPSFRPEDMLAGAALERYQDATSKGCWNYTYASFLKPPPGKMLRPGWDKTPAVERFVKNDEQGAIAIGGPMLVIGGEADQTVPIAQLKETTRKLCALKSAVTLRTYPGLDHDPTMEKSTPDQLAWIRERFEGKPSRGNCSRADSSAGASGVTP